MLWKEKRLPVPWRWLSSRLPCRGPQALSVPFLPTEFTAPLPVIITWVCQEWLTVTHQWVPVNQQDLPPSDEGLGRAVGAGEKGCEGKESGCMWTEEVASEFAWPFLPSETFSLYLVLRNHSSLVFAQAWFPPTRPRSLLAQSFCMHCFLSHSCACSLLALPSYLLLIFPFLVYGKASQPSCLGQSCHLKVPIGQCPLMALI